MFNLDQLERAHDIVGAAMPPTPAHRWPLLAERLGATVVVKHENHTPTGAFKVRGGLVYLDRLKRERPGTAGIISATHRQSRPEPRFRGAPLRRAGHDLRAARQFGREEPGHAGRSAPISSNMARIFNLPAKRPSAAPSSDGLEMVPSFHPDLVLGVATYALELLREAPDLDVLYVPIGQGSGISGCILARDLLWSEDGNRRRAVDGGAVLCVVVRGRHDREDEQQQYARRRHGDARSRPGCACDHPQGRLAHRAGHGRRDRGGDPRLLDRHP